MELSTEKLLKLKLVVKARYDRQQADLARLLATRLKLVDELSQIRSRSAVQIESHSDLDAGEVVAARNWAASRDTLEARTNEKIQELDVEIACARDRTRHAHGQVEACEKLDDDLEVQEAQKSARREDQANGTHAAGRLAIGRAT